MTSTRWRLLAVAATLSLGLAGCGDDTGGMMNVDMAVSMDLTATTGDMTQPPQAGSGQVIVADLVGTIWPGPNAPMGTPPNYHTHVVTAISSFHKVAPTADPSSNLNFGAMSGCVVNHYDLAAGKFPTSDDDAGPVVITGLNPTTVAFNGNMSASGNMAAGNPTQISCARGSGPVKLYGCFYGSAYDAVDGGNGAMNALTDSVAFPLLPINNPGNGLPYWKLFYPTTTCVDQKVIAVVGGTPVFGCEQHPIVFGGGAVLTYNVIGGADISAPPSAKTIPPSGVSTPDDGAVSQYFPEPVTIISVTGGSASVDGGAVTNIAGKDPLALNAPNLDLQDATFDGTTPLTFNWSCDGSQTIGSGCIGTGDIVGLLLQTSQHAKNGSGMSTSFGTAQCIAKVMSGTIQVQANQLTALIGGQHGSMRLALVRLRFNPTGASGISIYYLGGEGQFGFTNLP